MFLEYVRICHIQFILQCWETGNSKPWWRVDVNYTASTEVLDHPKQGMLGKGWGQDVNQNLNKARGQLNRAQLPHSEHGRASTMAV